MISRLHVRRKWKQNNGGTDDRGLKAFDPGKYLQNIAESVRIMEYLDKAYSRSNNGGLG